MSSLIINVQIEQYFNVKLVVFNFFNKSFTGGQEGVTNFVCMSVDSWSITWFRRNTLYLLLALIDDYFIMLLMTGGRALPTQSSVFPTAPHGTKDAKVMLICQGIREYIRRSVTSLHQPTCSLAASRSSVLCWLGSIFITCTHTQYTCWNRY